MSTTNMIARLGTWNRGCRPSKRDSTFIATLDAWSRTKAKITALEEAVRDAAHGRIHETGCRFMGFDVLLRAHPHHLYGGWLDSRVSNAIKRLNHMWKDGNVSPQSRHSLDL